jgi:hypothetical protein
MQLHKYMTIYILYLPSGATFGICSSNRGIRFSLLCHLQLVQVKVDKATQDPH